MTAPGRASVRAAAVSVTRRSRELPPREAPRSCQPVSPSFPAGPPGAVSGRGASAPTTDRPVPAEPTTKQKTDYVEDVFMAAQKKFDITNEE